MTMTRREREEHAYLRHLDLKRCSKCKATKSLSNFSVGRSNEDGLQSRCKACQKAYYDTHSRKRTSPELRSGQYLRYSYGLTKDAFKIILEEQNRLCALCKAPLHRGGILVDHCHKRGVIRGILCRKCNAGLGYYEHWNEQGIFESSIKAYLERASGGN